MVNVITEDIYLSHRTIMTGIAEKGNVSIAPMRIKRSKRTRGGGGRGAKRDTRNC